MTLRYPAEARDALDDISLSIRSGEFILVVGVNGSGKSSLLSVIAGLTAPTSGEIIVGGNVLAGYRPSSLHRAIAFVTQNEPLYPLSLRENLLMGLGSLQATQGEFSERDSEEDRVVKEAVEIAGCNHLLHRLGSSTVVNPCRVVAQSLRGCGNGDVGRGAYRELRRNDPAQRAIVLSPGEKQRLIL